MLLAACSCNSVRFAHYFPLRKDKMYTYHYTNDTLPAVSYRDTIVCRMFPGNAVNVWLKKTSMTILDTANRVEGGTTPMQVFYFEQLEPRKNDSAFFVEQSFGQLFYIYHKGALFMGESSRVSQHRNDPFARIFPKRVSFGKEYMFRSGDFKRIFKIDGREPVSLKGVTYKDCLKMTIREHWVNTYPTDTVWFKKGIGIVKRKKQDGNIGVLQ